MEEGMNFTYTADSLHLDYIRFKGRNLCFDFSDLFDEESLILVISSIYEELVGFFLSKSVIFGLLLIF